MGFFENEARPVDLAPMDRVVFWLLTILMCFFCSVVAVLIEHVFVSESFAYFFFFFGKN